MTAHKPLSECIHGAIRTNRSSHSTVIFGHLPRDADPSPAPCSVCYTFVMIRRRSIAVLVAASMAQAILAHEASISIEVVTEWGVQATAQREWMQLLTRAGANDVRLRSHQPGDEPVLSTTGSAERPRYKLLGVLDARGTLTLPGGKFNQRSAGKIRDYFNRLAADGTEGVLAERGMFGLTQKQTSLVHDDLAQQVEFFTKSLTLPDVLQAIDKATVLDLRMDDNAWKVARNAAPVADEVETLTIGTALALLLKRDGLVFVPTKERGRQVVHRIARASDIDGDTWPIGWKPNQPPSELAPAMMERLNAEVDDFTLSEAMESIEPRMGVPVYWDHAMLLAKQIDPAKVDVKLARQQTRLSRVVDRLLFQARLRGELKVDEAGTVFYWISR